MSHLPRHLLTLLWGSVPALSLAANCVLPVPDGGDKTPSLPNLVGQIVLVKGSDVVIEQRKTGKNVKLRLDVEQSVYTAFGGDLRVQDLTVGQIASVWFQNCTWPKTGLPSVMYFQIYSQDPKDRP